MPLDAAIRATTAALGIAAAILYLDLLHKAVEWARTASEGSPPW